MSLKAGIGSKWAVNGSEFITEDCEYRSGIDGQKPTYEADI